MIDITDTGTQVKTFLFMLGLMVLPWLWIGYSTNSWSNDKLYTACADLHKFPKGEQTGYVPPKVLYGEDKKRLVECAEKYQDEAFTKWVRKALAADIKRGDLRAPKGPEKDDDASMSAADAAGVLGTGLLVLVGSGLVIGLVHRSVMTGAAFAVGPVVALVIGLCCLMFSTVGMGTSAGQRHFDEMDGMALVFLYGFGVFVLAVAAVWLLVRSSRGDD